MFLDVVFENVADLVTGSGRDPIRLIAIKLHTKDQLDFGAVLHNVFDLAFVIPDLK